MTLELQERELDELVELIDRRITEMRVEIHRTESPSYREKLEEENRILTSLRQRLPVSAER